VATPTAPLHPDALLAFFDALPALFKVREQHFSIQKSTSWQKRNPASRSRASVIRE
jgi:hypothetical protein